MLKSASLARKILLVCCSFMVPIAALQWLIIKAYNKDINFGAWEFKGDKLQRPVENLFEAVATHKLLVGHSSDAAAAKAQLAKVQAAVEQALADTATVEEELREDLQFTDQGLASRGRDSARSSKITEQWNALKGKLAKISIEESDKLHDEIIANVRTMIVHGGDTSNLILDPDLDSYYLMDITLLAGPQMQDRLQRVTAEVGDLLEKKDLTFAEKMKINTFAAMLQEADLDRIKGDVGTVLNEDKNFYGVSPSVQKNLPANFEVLKGKVDKVIAHLTSVANGGKVEQAVFRADGLAALGESFRFWNSAVDEMDVFLNTRLADYDGKRTMATAMSLACLVIFTALTVFVTRHLKTNFISAVERLKVDADAIRNLSQDIRFTSKTVASGSHEQGAAVQENVAAITEIDSMVEKTSEQASLSLANARSVAEQARQGNTVMNKMVESMQSIKSATDQLEAITSVISTIADRTNVINDIVFKTQLLSFNASIEAARAGQHGRGFAVVAEEVGNLAQMSGNAAAEIRRLIDDSKKQVDGFVKSTQERINRGETISDQAKAIFDRISSEIDQIARQVESVSDANREQKAGIGQVSMAMTQIEQVTQSNVNAASQADELSAGLEAQSQKLTEVAGMIESLVAGGKGQGRRSATTSTKGSGKGQKDAPKAEQPAPQAQAATPAAATEAQGFKRVQGQGEWDTLLKDSKTEDTRKVA